MKIPRYNAQVELTKQAPGVMIDASAYGQQARAMGEIGQVLSGIGEKFREIRKEDEIGKATIQAKNLLNQTEWDALNDTDLNQYEERYAKKLEEAKNNVMSNIKDREASVEFGRRLDLTMVDSKFKIQQYYRQKSIDSGRATLAENLSSLQTDFINSDNQESKKQQLGKIELLLNKAADDGLIGRKDAADSLINIKSQLPERQAAFDAANRPEEYFANRGNYGIAPDKLADTDKIAEKTLSELELTTIQQKFESQKSFDSTVGTSSIAEQIRELEDGASSGKYDDKWAESKKKAILSKANINPFERDRFASEISMAITALKGGYEFEINGKKKNKIPARTAQEYLRNVQDVVIDINNGVAKGLLDPKSARDYIGKLYDTGMAVATERSVETGSGPGAFFRYDIKDADEVFKKAMGLSDRHKALREFFFRTDGKDLSREELKAIEKDIVRKAQQKNYPEYGIYIVGDMMPTPKGNFKIVGITDAGEPIIEVPNINKEEGNAENQSK